jgi:benzil reductase ((S)-benzoin forming)
MNILITGISSGIGAGLALHYLKEKHHVVGISRRNNSHLEVFPNFKYYSADLSEKEETMQVLQLIAENYQSFDLLVLNAGILNEIDRMEKQSWEDVHYMMDVNVWSNKVLLDACLTKGIRLKQVVGISSGAAKNGSAGWGPYSISKAALNMLLKTYAAENAEIHFSSVAPGLVETAMQHYIFGLPKRIEFPTIERLQGARGTDQMPDGEKLAPRLATVFNALLSHPSGIFIDIRDEEWRGF